jgi:hypothetical protein
VVLPKNVFLQNEPKVVQCLPRNLKKREANQSHFKAKKSQFEPNQSQIFAPSKPF